MTRNIISLSVLVLLVSVLSVNARTYVEPEIKELQTVEEFSKIDDILELIRKHLKVIRECIKEAKENCKPASAQGPVEGLRCVIKHIVSQQGKCKPPVPTTSERPPSNSTQLFD